MVDAIKSWVMAPFGTAFSLASTRATSSARSGTRPTRPTMKGDFGYLPEQRTGQHGEGAGRNGRSY
ncbi:hypothetical protein [Halorientalis salina]|uniref:hypothetical protein n=1 Tax=Halorientalis salina TaxID=2932266 RepID=UPI0010AD5ACB|nr:hypothetical protein [Halorientalis salina]